jgi:sirohydrochlorin ferrochelatase
VHRLKTGILLVGHGTRDASGQHETSRLVEKVAQAAAPRPVGYGFIEQMQPTIEEGLGRLAGDGVTRACVVPLLLFSAGHAKSDVPRAIKRAVRLHPMVEVSVISPFGLDENLLALSERRYTDVLAGRPPVPASETYWLFVGRGSSDPSATEEAQRFAAARACRSHIVHHGVAFVAAARPSLNEAMAVLSAGSWKRVIVQPHLLFCGAVLDEVKARVELARLARPEVDWIATGHLGPTDEVVAAVLSRVTE